MSIDPCATFAHGDQALVWAAAERRLGAQGHSVTPPIDMPATAAVRPDPGDRPYAPACRRFEADVAPVIAVEHFGGTPTVTVPER